MTAEDGLADTVRPRLDAAGADPRYVWAFRAVIDRGESRPPSIPVDVPLLENIVNEKSAGLVIVDG